MRETKAYIVIYRRYDNLEVVGYSDNIYAGCVDSKKSMSVYIFTLDRRVISWKSSEKTIITSFTMQTEYITCYKATGKVVWLNNFIPELKVVKSISRQLLLYYGNEPVMFYTSNNRSNAAAKHIITKYRVVKHRIQDQTINVKHISTVLMLTDPLRKGLLPSIFHEHVARHGIAESLAILEQRDHYENHSQ
jgi:hypothetical protein